MNASVIFKFRRLPISVKIFSAIAKLNSSKYLYFNIGPAEYFNSLVVRQFSVDENVDVVDRVVNFDCASGRKRLPIAQNLNVAFAPRLIFNDAIEALQVVLQLKIPIPS